MKIVNEALLDLTGSALMAGDLPLTTATVLLNCAMSAAPANAKPRPRSEVSSRYVLMVALFHCVIGEEVEVPDALVDRLIDDLLRLYAPLVAGPIILLLEGKPVPQA